MQVALRKRYLDVIGHKGLIDGAVEFMAHAAAINGPIDPAQQLEIQTGVTESPEPYSWGRCAADTGVLGRHRLQCCDHVIDVAAIGDTNGDTNTMLWRWSARFVYYFAVAENAVRDRNFNIIAC